jgi:hypothetical protein
MFHLSGSTPIDLKNMAHLWRIYPVQVVLSIAIFKGWLGIQNWLAHIKLRKRVEVNQEVNI